MDSHNQKRWVVSFAVKTAALLTVLKLSFAFISGSLAILASAVDSLMDVLVSVVNYLSLREADKPADSDHAYGHGKIESLAGLFQAVLIAASGAYLVFESIRRIIKGTMLTHLDLSIVVMVISMALTFLLVRKLRAASLATGSVIVQTESLHYTMDILTNGGVICALFLVRWTGLAAWDLVIAVVIAAYIIRQSIRILKVSIDELIDRSLPEEFQNEVRNMIRHHDSRIIGIHNLRTRKMGGTKFIDFHVELKGNLSFKEAHDLTENLISVIQKKYPGTDVTAHYDPEGGV